MTTIISQEQLERQKRMLIASGIFFIAMGIIMIGMAFLEEKYMVLFILPLCIVLPFQFFNDLKRISSISYDDGAVYYLKLGSIKAKAVPFENIRSITIGRFDSAYRINLIAANEDGTYVYFRYQTFWTPFIHTGKEDVFILRDKIDACKKRNDHDFTGQTQIIEMAQLK